MKKVLSLFLFSVLLLSLTACRKEENKEANVVSSTVKETTTTTATNAWKQFLIDYDGFVDEYVEIIKKYKENPADMSILSEYTDMVSKTSEWNQKAYTLEEDLEVEESLEYSAELLRILQKITDATK